MTQLNYHTYKLLRQAYENTNPIIKCIDDKDWYELTYELFQEASLNNINDLWKIVAYTYSWMPTIPEVKPQLIKDSDALLVNLQKLRKGDTISLSTLLEELIPVINNSLVGVSKVLHFIAPTTIPIIDRNVLRGWDAFFFKFHPEYSVPQLPQYKTSLNCKHISKYLAYRDVLLDWVAATENQVSLRELEITFFELGKNLPPEEVELPVYKLMP